MHADTPRDDLDAIIDDAARTMTSAPLPPSLRESVGAALSPRRRFQLQWWQLAAASSLIVLAIAGALRQEAPWGVEELPSGAYAAREGDIPMTAAPAPATAAPIADAPAPRLAVRAARLAPAAEPIVVEPIALPLLMEPAEAAMIAVDSLSAPMPLALEALAIEPLTLE